jgi:hypothetical protein
MTPAMGLWIVVVGVAVYFAVRSALGDHDRAKRL